MGYGVMIGAAIIADSGQVSKPIVAGGYVPTAYDGRNVLKPGRVERDE